MSKMRVYELAKELGLENKVVVAKAIELGIPGVASHSNSIDASDGDRIRRALRQAAQAGQKSETVTTRVDKSTGTSQAILESRSGNVIRRRRAPPGEAGSGSATQSVAEATPPLETGIPSPQNGASNGNLAHALSEESAPEAPVETPAAPPVEAPTIPAEEEVTEEAQEVPEAAEIQEEAPVVETQATAATSGAAAVEEPKKPGIGPKVLGKIVLPIKKVAKPETKRPTSGGVAAPAVTEEEEDSDKKGGAKKKSKKREITRFDLADYDGREGRRTRSGGKGKKEEAVDKRAALESTKMKQSKRVVKFNESITVGELAKQMSLKVGEVIAKLMELGMMATINQALDQDTATIVAGEFQFQVESVSFDEAEVLKEVGAESPENLKSRAPVVTVMGHVDHGKTSLLDAIRNASVAEKEHGGITQHIGAYRVTLPDERWITFIDTPGHAAFTQMRARGAKVTDIVVLVVAADEGVMPQTLEALNHAKAAEVPIVVAVNKMDKPGANLDRAKQQLAEHGLSPEEWGGDTMYIPVSALKKTGIKELLEGLLLVAEMKQLKANPDRRATGAVIEARQEKGRGAVATILVQQGTLNVGDLFVCGADYGKVRSMLDHNGKKVDRAGPSFPVEITGFGSVPDAGDEFMSTETEAKAREIAQHRAEKKRLKEERALATGPISLEEFARRANNMEMESLNVILKADVHGSVEAVRDALEKLSTDKVKVRVLHAAVGGVNESDVQLAIASKAIIVGFGVRSEARAMEDAERSGIDVRFYRIIYEVIDDVKKAMSGLLEPIKKESHLGRADVRNTFVVPKIGTIGGCFVTEGLVRRAAHVRVLRDSRVIFEGRMGSLRRFKDDAREVASGYECGIGIDGFNDIKVGDVLDVYEIQEIAQTID